MASSPDLEKSATPTQLVDILQDDGPVDAIQVQKVNILNTAIQDIGMGRYQWQLFIVTGLAWLVDNLWLIVVGLIIPPVVNEFHVDGPFLQLSGNIGLLVGATFWSFGSDIWGRKISFHATLFTIGAFSLAAGGSTNYIGLASLAAIWSTGVGGNLPVDSAIFLEFVPSSHQYLLTVLSVWWPLGQLVASVVAWPLMGTFSCPTTDPPTCPRALNQGWRYFLFCMGGLSLLIWVLIYVFFDSFESPKYLAGRGYDEQAVESVRKVALKNRRWKEQDGNAMALLAALQAVDGEKAVSAPVRTSVALRRSLEKLSLEHIRGLFRTKMMATSTTLLIIIWGFIGLAYPLYHDFIPYYLATRGAEFGDGSVSTAYRNQTIIAAIGVPATIIAGYMVEMPLLGRRGTLAVSTALTGACILASTTARSSTALLGWMCGYSFTANIMYGVLYAITPEIFPTKYRGTGNALVAIAGRIFGIMSPIIALYADLRTSVPVFVSGGLFVAAGLITMLLPHEPRGKAAM